jgi:hypothetical protein
MVMYQYRCNIDGQFDINLPIGTAPTTMECPSCDESSGRVFAAPMLGLADRRRMAVIEHSEKSRHEPDVVSVSTGAPRRRTPMAPSNPALTRLPRP